MSSPIKQMGKGVALAEKNRDKKRIDTFFADIFRGKASFEKITWAEKSEEETKEREKILIEIKRFLMEETNPKEMSRTMDVPLELFEKMAKIGLFALKVPRKFGGKGLSQSSFNKVIELITSYGGPLPIVVSADASIGAKFPVVNYGTDEQKAIFIPELIKWPSGFAFTEQDAGSDATRMKMAAVRIRDKSGHILGYELTGQKWYTTNSVYRKNVPLARFLAVVGKIGDTLEEIKAISEDESKEDCFGIFIVPTDSQGLEIGPRNKFIGMAGIYNANPKLQNVFVPEFNLIGGEGKGFRIAMGSLNTGRIAIAAGCIAMAEQALLMSIKWGNMRKQFGKPIGQFEKIGSGMLVPGAADIFAMIAMTKFAALCYDRGLDVRIEAAACKAFASEKMWLVVDNMMQIFGGRGYEAEDSWSLREAALPVSRLFVDARPNRIFEGATELLAQSGVRDAIDDYLTKGRIFFEKGKIFKKFTASLGFAGQYGKLIFPGSVPRDFPERLKKHLDYIENRTRILSREIIKLSAIYKGKLSVKQLTIWRLFWIGIYLNAMTIVCHYALYLSRNSDNYLEPIELADFFCCKTIRELEGSGLFSQLYKNDDNFAREISEKLLAGKYDFILKEGIIPFVDLVK